MLFLKVAIMRKKIKHITTATLKLLLVFSLIVPGFYSNSLQANVSFTKDSNSIDVSNINKYYWVIYDSVCPYCREARKHIKSLDWEGKFKFISYRDPQMYKMFPDLNKKECAKDVHMVTPDGQVLVGYKVFRTIIDNLTATKILNPLLKNDFAERKLNEIYKKMVEKRTCYYKKSGTCALKNNNKE